MQLIKLTSLFSIISFLVISGCAQEYRLIQEALKTEPSASSTPASTPEPTSTPCPAISCAAPPNGCTYVNPLFAGECQISCGTLSCATPTPAPATPTPTATPIPATPTPTATPGPTATATPTVTPTATPGPTATATPVPTCTQTIEDVTINLRILFMVDHSGSTFGGSGTDADYRYRVGAIQAFLDKYKTKANFTYSFGYFGADKAYLFDYQNLVYKQTSANPPIARYFGTAAELSTPNGTTGALQKYLKVPQDLNANTPYQKAFNADKVAVTVDVGNNHANYKYVIIFMSDGQPNPDISDTNLKTLINDTQATATAGGSALTVSSVYFGPANGTTAINKMKLIATEGEGQFVNTNVNSDFNINDVIQVPGCK